MYNVYKIKVKRQLRNSYAYRYFNAIRYKSDTFCQKKNFCFNRFNLGRDRLTYTNYKVAALLNLMAVC